MSIIDWIRDKWDAFIEYLNLEPCHKESMGYTCHHRLLTNGKKECGGPDE